jgi:transposase-like protein
MSKRSYSLEVKLEILKALEDGQYSINEVSTTYNVQHSTISEWQHKLEQYGIEGLKESTTWKRYSKDLKLSGNHSLREIARKYEISNSSALMKWINKYNSHREIKATAEGRSQSMTKGRSTTWEERIQIVLYCIENEKNYKKAADTFEVSYQQVYQWVTKYENGGDEALKDKRGRNKVEAELSPEEKIRLEMKRLERENERLTCRKFILKKVRGDRKEEKVSPIRFEDKYMAIQELHEKEDLNILLLCDIAGISRAAYYKWLKRTPSEQELQNEEIIKEMKILHEKVDGIYGYRRMKLNINRTFGQNFNHKRIRRLMTIAGIQSVIQSL